MDFKKFKDNGLIEEKGKFSFFLYRCEKCSNSYQCPNNQAPKICQCSNSKFNSEGLFSYSRKPASELSKEVQEILKNPTQTFLFEIPKLFSGETNAALGLFLICGLRFVKNHSPASSNLLVNSESGAGKDFVLSKILTAFDSNFVLARSRISPTVLNYWHNSRNEPNWTWDEKILYLADVSNSILNSEVLKCFVTGQNSATITEKGKAIEFEIFGKPIVLLTAASPSQGQEQLRRFPILMLNETAEQTKAILGFQASLAQGNNHNAEFSPNFKEAMSWLEPQTVVVPFANLIAQKFPSNLNARTAFVRLIDYVKAAAAINQFSRERKTNDLENFITASIEPDYSLGKMVFELVTSNERFIPLTARNQKILAFFKEHEGRFFTIQSLLKDIEGIPERTIRRDIDKLVSNGFLKAEEREIEGSIRPVVHYCFSKFNNLVLPTPKELLEMQNQLAEQAEQAKVSEQAKLAKQEKSGVSSQFANFAQNVIDNDKSSLKGESSDV